MKNKLFALLACTVLSPMAALAQPANRPDDSIAQRAVACLACHGAQDRVTQSGYFPRIAGKPAGYLYQQLRNFRDDKRRYPQMNYMVAQLSDDYLRELAAYFAGLDLPYPAPRPPAVSAATIEQGRQLAMHGNPAKNIPACVACHGQRLTGVLPAMPSLLGLPRDYLNAQFGAWKTGARRAAAPDCMAEVSRQLSTDEIAAVSAWLSSRAVPEDASPARGLTLPVACGSHSGGQP